MAHAQSATPPKTSSLTRLALLAIAAAAATMGLKFLAYFQTGSVGMLSDAVESSANLVAAMTALFAVWFAARPVDRTHNYGHEKVEFFAGIFIRRHANSKPFRFVRRTTHSHERG